MEWVGADKDVAFSDKGQENWPSPHQIIAILKNPTLLWRLENKHIPAENCQSWPLLWVNKGSPMDKNSILYLHVLKF